MKELHKFILNKTNASPFFEARVRDYEIQDCKISLSIWDQVLNPCGMPPWMLNHYYHHPQFKRAEHIAISLEENLIHPIIAIQTIILKVWDVLINLHDIQSEIIIEVGYLNTKTDGDAYDF